MSERKPILVLAAVGLVVVGLYAAGVVGASGDRGDGSADWRRRLGAQDRATPLRPDDLRMSSGSCTWIGQTLRIPSRCTLLVDPGATLTTTPVRAATLTGSLPMTVVMVVQDRRIEADLEVGESLRITVGPEGGSVELVCRALDQTCQLGLGGP